MDILRSPTDNLYKFLAISGIALIAVGAVLTNDLLEERTEASIQASVSAENIRNYVDVKEKLLDLRERIYSSKYKVDIIEEENVENAIDGLLETNRMLEKHIEDFSERTLETRLKTEKIFAIERFFKWRLFLDFMLIALGVVTSVYGFFTWYHRLQKYQDVIIRLKAKEGAEPDAGGNSEAAVS